MRNDISFLSRLSCTPFWATDTCGQRPEVTSAESRPNVGPAPKRPCNPNIYYRYGYDWFKLSGAGHQISWGVHHFDIVAWAMGVNWPIAASGMGEHFACQDGFEWPNTLDGMVIVDGQ